MNFCRIYYREKEAKNREKDVEENLEKELNKTGRRGIYR